MIIENGLLQFKRKKTGSAAVDPETGYPARRTGDTWGDLIPCQIVPNKYDNLGRVNGQHFTTASYQIYIDRYLLEDSEQIRIITDEGSDFLEYSIISVEVLQAVDEVLILV